MHSAWPGQQLYPDRVPAKRLRTREKHSSGAHTPLRPPPPHSFDITSCCQKLYPSPGVITRKRRAVGRQSEIEAIPAQTRKDESIVIRDRRCALP